MFSAQQQVGLIVVGWAISDGRRRPACNRVIIAFTCSSSPTLNLQTVFCSRRERDSFFWSFFRLAARVPNLGSFLPEPKNLFILWKLEFVWTFRNCVKIFRRITIALTFRMLPLKCYFENMTHSSVFFTRSIDMFSLKELFQHTSTLFSIYMARIPAPFQNGDHVWIYFSPSVLFGLRRVFAYGIIAFSLNSSI